MTSQAFPTWEVHNHADALEPMDDVMKRLTGKYGAGRTRSASISARLKGHWLAVPTSSGTQNKPAVRAHQHASRHGRASTCGAMYPAQGRTTARLRTAGPGTTFLKAAEACHEGRHAVRHRPRPVPPTRSTSSARCSRAFGATLVDEKGNITVKSDAVRQVLDYAQEAGERSWRRTTLSYDDASNNRALISGKSALIFNPPSAWAVAKRDAPQVAADCWTFPSPAGPKGRFVPYLPYFWGVWNFSRNKTAAKELIDLPDGARAGRGALTTRWSGYDIPPFDSMDDFKIWAEVEPPKGTVYNYPIAAWHDAKPHIAAMEAPPDIAVQIYNQAVHTIMIAKYTFQKQSMDQAHRLGAERDRRLHALGAERALDAGGPGARSPGPRYRQPSARGWLTWPTAPRSPLGLQAAARRGRWRRGTLYVLAHRRSTIAFLMALPLILLVVGLVVYPACYAIYLSLLNKHMTAFVGLGNFVFLLERQTFQMVICQSCLFAVTAVVLKALIGFIARASDAQHPEPEPAHLARPAAGALGDPAGAVHARLVVDVRSVLFGVQLDAEPARRAVGRLARATAGRRASRIIAVNTWYGTPFFMIMYLAALKSVPEQLYEAAAIDGAGAAAEAALRDAADDAQHHLHHRAVQPDRHLRQFRHRAHPDRWRAAGPDASLRHLRLPGRHPVGRHPARRRDQPVHVPDPGGGRLLRAARRHPAHQGDAA